MYEAPWSLGLFIILMCTDFVDGAVARKFNMKSELGEVLDPIADKLVVISSLIRALYEVARAGFASFAIFFVIAFFIIFREAIVWLYRLKAKQKGIRTPSLFLGKAKVWVESIALVFLLAVPNQWGSVYIALFAAFCGIPVYVIGIITALGAVVLAYVSLFQLKNTYPELFEDFL